MTYVEEEMYSTKNIYCFTTCYKMILHDINAYSSRGSLITWLNCDLAVNMSLSCMCWVGLMILYVPKLSMADAGNVFGTSYDVFASKKCNVTTNGMWGGYKVNCSGLGLSCIPLSQALSVNSSLVTQLILTNNQIEQIPKMAFHKFPNLLHLDLSTNPLGKCENGSFEGLSALRGLKMTNITPDVFLVFESDTFLPLKSLEWMDLSYSFIHKKSFFAALCSVVSDLQTLTLNDLQDIRGPLLTDLTEEMTKCFRYIRLKNLSLEGCQLNRISFRSALNLVHLEEVSFRRNQFTVVQSKLWIYLAASHNMNYFDGSCQNYPECVDIFPWSEWLPHTPVMYQHSTINNTLTENNKGVLDTNKTVINLYFLPNLQTLKLDHLPNPYVKGVHVPSVCWKNNKLVNIDGSFLTTLYVEDTVYCMDHLMYLNLRGIKKLILGAKAFHALTKLEVLMLGSANLGSVLTKESNVSALLFRHNINLRFLDMSNLGLKELNKDIFKTLTKLEFLILSQNKLKNVANDLISSLSSLHHLDLSYNMFQDIPIELILQFQRTNKSQQKYLRLSHNPFICDCQSIEKIKAMKMSGVVIEGIDGTNRSLMCVLPNRNTVTLHEAVHSLTPLCINTDQVSIVFLTLVYPFILVIIVVVNSCYRHRWTLNYVWYSILGHLQMKDEDNKDFQFDAYVAYAQEDVTWVQHILLPKLENARKNYTLCIEDRDFLVGESIAEEINSGIKQSRKTILLVTKSFLKSKWCTFAARSAQTHHIMRPTGLIAVVFSGVHEISSKHSLLNDLLDTVTCLDWPGDKNRQSMFWLQLCRFLGRAMKTTKDDGQKMVNTA